MDRYCLVKYTATADEQPDKRELYNYAKKHGACDDFGYTWCFTDLTEALKELSMLETSCQKLDDKYYITCYALETMKED